MRDRNKRIDYIDLFRAWGILLMIMGHVAFGGGFDKWIHIFHMPMFFIVSGYFYKKQEFLILLRKRLKCLILPYFIFGLMHILIYYYRLGRIDFHALYLLLWENTADNGIPISGALWFLSAMFISEIVFYFVFTHFKSDIIKTLTSFAISIAGIICANYLPFRLPWAIDAGMVGVAFYQVGGIIHKKQAQLEKVSLVYTVFSIILFSCLGLINDYVNLRMGYYGIWPLFYVSAIGLSLAFWNMFRLVHIKFYRKRVLDRALSVIEIMGRDSIVFLCLNQLIILLLSEWIGSFLPSTEIKMILLKKIIILVLTIIALYIICMIVNKTRLKKVFGK